MILAYVAMGQHVIAQLLAVAQPGAVPQHDPGVRPQHSNVVGNVLGIGRTYPDIDHGDARMSLAHQVVRGHLGQARGSLPSASVAWEGSPTRRVTTLPGSTNAV